MSAQYPTSQYTDSQLVSAIYRRRNQLHAMNLDLLVLYAQRGEAKAEFKANMRVHTDASYMVSPVTFHDVYSAAKAAAFFDLKIDELKAELKNLNDLQTKQKREYRRRVNSVRNAKRKAVERYKATAKRHEERGTVNRKGQLSVFDPLTTTYPANRISA